MPLISITGQDPEPLLSVIVPCYNSEQTIRDCLNALLEQQTTAPYEIIVVDSSSDRTPLIVREEFSPVRLIHLAERTFAGKSRNRGVKSSRGRYCAMIDSDCVADVDLIDRVLARHEEADYAAVGGSLRSGSRGSVSGWISYLLEFKEFMPTTPMRIEPGMPTANLTYRREDFESYGGFDEDMRLSEDILFNWKLHQAGERMLFDPAIRVTHLNRTGWREVLGYQVSLGRWSAVARRRGGLRGGVLLRHRWLIFLMPFVRTLRAFQSLARYDQRGLFWFFAAWPAYFLAASLWAWGFFHGTRDTGLSGIGIEGATAVREDL
jgi:glycosyltransferase involved in cell wall biosynthesis